MATAETNFATVESLLDFLGIDEDSESIVARQRESAIEELFRATGIHWQNQEPNKVAEEVIHIMVYMAYYGLRGGIANTEHLERRRTALIKQLQYPPEVTEYG